MLPVFVDSPMAIEALARYTERVRELDPEMQPEERDDKAPHGPADATSRATSGASMRGRERQLCAFCTERFRTIASPQRIEGADASRMPAIVISSSGMATGGRVLHHLKAALPDPRNTVLFVGYQAAGTRGRQLVDGAQTVKIHGQIIPGPRPRRARSTRCRRTPTRSEILRWLGGFDAPPSTTFLVHGEPAAMEALAGVDHGESSAGTSKLPQHGETVELEHWNHELTGITMTLMSRQWKVSWVQ